MAERAEPVLRSTRCSTTMRLPKLRGDWAHALVWLPAPRQSEHVAERMAALKRRLDPLLAEVGLVGSAATTACRKTCNGCTTTCAWCARRQARCNGQPPRCGACRTCELRRQDGHAAGAGHREGSLAHRSSTAIRTTRFPAYVEAFQTVTALNMSELSLLVPALKLVVLEEFAGRGNETCWTSPSSHRSISDADGQHARAVGGAVEGTAGAADCVRAGAGARSRQGLCAHGFPEPRAVSPHGGALRRALRLLGAGDCAAGASSMAQESAEASAGRPAAGLAKIARRLLPDRRRRASSFARRAGVRLAVWRKRAGIPAPASRRVLSGRHRTADAADRDRDHDAGLQRFNTFVGRIFAIICCCCCRRARAPSR